jgi:RHS repeat-associated protein
VVYAAAHDPWGGIQQTWVSAYDPALKFSGKERDTESGLDYFGARYYDHSLYRFLSVDPVIPKNQAMYLPKRWNLYQYCRNNPISYIDSGGDEDKYYAYYEILYMGYYGGAIYGEDYLITYSVSAEYRDWNALKRASGSFQPVIDDVVVWDNFIWVKLRLNVRILTNSHMYDQPNITKTSEENTMRHEMRHLNEFLWMFDCLFRKIANDWRQGKIDSIEKLEDRIRRAANRAWNWTKSRWDDVWMKGFWFDILQNWIPFLQEPLVQWVFCY